MSPHSSLPSNPRVTVLDEEYAPLADIVCGSPRATPGLALLWNELSRATLVQAGRAPADVVRLGSAVEYTDLTRRESRRIRLVLPREARPPALEPVSGTIGAALLGLRPGDVFHWRAPSGELRSLQVDAVEPPLAPRISRPRQS
ncbi:transcription elongation factor [Phenylobacterium zucineum HLK1]|uniref:Transcription elongation factor n=1 Tax=Phenylobacterium zucineum (strain HLK1) TaxID=450851 RepID=B4RBL2_PHEZH|nr:GreA/GreB family elongation factor [Phenylobacterium zucineum]ACG76472.1 transcription elongation factor [Phenylobacterium zucineum HLK1]